MPFPPLHREPLKRGNPIYSSLNHPPPAKCLAHSSFSVNVYCPELISTLHTSRNLSWFIGKIFTLISEKKKLLLCVYKLFILQSPSELFKPPVNNLHSYLCDFKFVYQCYLGDKKQPKWNHTILRIIWNKKNTLFFSCQKSYWPTISRVCKPSSFPTVSKYFCWSKPWHSRIYHFLNSCYMSGT